MDAALQVSPGNDGLILFNRDGVIAVISRVPGSAEVFASPYAPGATVSAIRDLLGHS